MFPLVIPDAAKDPLWLGEKSASEFIASLPNESPSKYRTAYLRARTIDGAATV